MLRALTARAPAAPAPHLEFLLQKVLMLLATMARRAGGGRSPLQLRGAAATAYHALRTVAACEVGALVRLCTMLCCSCILLLRSHASRCAAWAPARWCPLSMWVANVH